MDFTGASRWTTTYALDGAKTPELSLEITLVRIVTESRNDERLEGIASNVGVLGWFVWMARKSAGVKCQERPSSRSEIRIAGEPTAEGDLLLKTLLRSLLLQLLAVAHLQPALGWDVAILVFVRVERRQVIGQATDGGSLALLGRFVGVFDPSQRRPGRKKRKKLRRQFVRHRASSSRTGRQKIRRDC